MGNNNEKNNVLSWNQIKNWIKNNKYYFFKLGRDLKKNRRHINKYIDTEFYYLKIQLILYFVYSMYFPSLNKYIFKTDIIFN